MVSGSFPKCPFSEKSTKSFRQHLVTVDGDSHGHYPLSDMQKFNNITPKDLSNNLPDYTSGKSKKFLVGLMTTYSDLVNILSKIKQNSDKEEPTCHK